MNKYVLHLMKGSHNFDMVCRIGLLRSVKNECNTKCTFQQLGSANNAIQIYRIRFTENTLKTLLLRIYNDLSK